MYHRSKCGRLTLSNSAGDEMSESQHTPGPWAVRPNANDDWGIVRAADGASVADAGVFTRCADFRNAEDDNLTNAQWQDGPPEVAANARLIAAAPDLLAALEYIVAWKPLDWDAAKARGMARAAIAKAKGGA